MLRPIVASLATALLVLAPGTVQESGRDPLRLYPENYALLLENDHVRVLEFTLKKGARESFHEHPKHVAVVLQGFKIRFTFPDGRTAIREQLGLTLTATDAQVVMLAIESVQQPSEN